MQVAKVKQVVKPELISQVYETALSHQADKTKVQASNAVDSQTQTSCKRMFEAYGDCV